MKFYQIFTLEIHLIYDLVEKIKKIYLSNTKKKSLTQKHKS